MIIYSVWYSSDCSMDYYKTKESAKAAAKEWLIDYMDGCLDEEIAAAVSQLDTEDYVMEDDLGCVLAIDEVIVHD